MIIFHVDINKSQVSIITGILHVDIIHLARRGQKYATLISHVDDRGMLPYTAEY